MITLTLTGNEWNEFQHIQQADSFDVAALALLDEIRLCYDIVPPELYTKLGELADEEQDAEVSHSDFSTPEENFTLKLKFND